VQGHLPSLSCPRASKPCSACCTAASSLCCCCHELCTHPSAGTPADKILHMMTELMDGSIPTITDILYVQSALLESHNIYQPLRVKQQIMQSDKLEVRGCCLSARARGPRRARGS
jgi:hypothetical protein